MTTKAKLTELIRRRLVNDNPSVSDKVKDPEVHIAIEMAANKVLRAQSLDNFNLEGQTMIDGVQLATYERLTVKRGNGNTCIVNLPATPVSLPYGMGVFAVAPSGEFENELIPVPAGVYNTLKKDRVLSSIGNNFYSLSGDKIIIYADLLGAGVGEVDMQLCVASLSRLEAHDILPVTADMQGVVVEYALALLQNKTLPEA